MSSNDWYYDGTNKDEWGFDPLEDFTPEEKEAARIFVEKFNSEGADRGFKFEPPSSDYPFGQWTRENDEFGGTSLNIQVAQGSDSYPDREYPDGFEMWVYAGEGMELPGLVADWNQVDKEIRETIEIWSRG